MKNVAVVFGGDSSEFVVSEQSAANVFGWVDTEKYRPYMVIMRHGDWRVQRAGKPDAAVDKNDFSALIDGVRVKFDVALIVIHGAPGENGVLQSYFDLTGVPYSTCGAFASMLTFNKAACKAFLADTGVAMAKAVLIRRGDAVNAADVVQTLGLPIFVKPNNGGSSFGVTKVKSEAALLAALEEAFREDGEVIAEEFIGGVEVTCGMMSLSGVETVLPVTEVVSKNEFFDFGAKYNGESEEITPARLSPEATALVQRTTAQVYQKLGCSGIIRADYILRNGTPYFLEVNTVPGMTAASFIPQQVRAAGLTMTQVLSDVIEDAVVRQKRLPQL
ncbi:MAG: D-alanine--D-alanine ligase [Prevotellaceae bacterium]|jgi:D-alanine-D-alanine ligase|nr:D-alanine--D-alanine ligase [Prevotellaceae bacterium]